MQENAMSTSLVTTPAPSAAPWQQFRMLLESQRADCLQQRELALSETAASNPDPVAVSRVATLLHTVREIDAALERIAAGTYGCCVHCGAAIPAERLEFRPFASGCVSCSRAAR
jgi:DnaK suppressor protein